jgi:hypothetical protein
MRKILISIAAAGAAVMAASPAVAQYYPAPQPYGYNSYGYQNNWGEVRALHARIDNIERQIRYVERRGGDYRADRLREEAQRLEQQLRWEARDGLNPWEARNMQVRIARLEQRVQYLSAGGYGSYGYNSYGYGNRDGNGGEDRWEHRRDDREDRDED